MEPKNYLLRVKQFGADVFTAGVVLPDQGQIATTTVPPDRLRGYPMSFDIDIEEVKEDKEDKEPPTESHPG